MSKASHKKMWKKINTEEYHNIIKQDGFYCDDFDGEFICSLDSDTVITLKPHYATGIFMGYNVYALNGDEISLLETFDSRKKAEKFIQKLADKGDN